MTVGGQNRKGSKVFISNLFMYFFPSFSFNEDEGVGGGGGVSFKGKR